MRRLLPLLLAFLVTLGFAAWLLLRESGAPHAIPAGDEEARGTAGPARPT